MGYSPVPGAARLVPNAADSPSPGSLLVSKSGLTPFNFLSPLSGFRTTTPIPGLLAGGQGQGQTPFLSFDTPTLLAASAVLPDHIPSLDTIGLGSMKASVRDSEAELRQIISKLRTQTGRISPQAIERVARQLDLDVDPNATFNGEPALSIGGINFVIELELNGDIVTDVTIEHGDGMNLQVDLIKNVLKNDLVFVDPAEKLSSSIGPFAEHLSWLSKMDKMTSKTEFPCYRAIESFHRSFKSLWEDECQHTNPDVVLQSGSGKPRLHEDENLGPVITYWRTRHRLPTSRSPRGSRQQSRLRQTTLNAHIHLEEHPSTTFPVAQASQSWLGDPPTLNPVPGSPTTSRKINWVCPLHLEDDPFVMNVDQPTPAAASAKLPNVRFIARLEPPVVLPQSIATAIAEIIGITTLSDPEFFVVDGYFDITLLPPSTPELVQLWNQRYCTTHLTVQNVPRRIARHANADAAEFDLTWEANYNEPGVQVKTLPFTHPKHLLDVIPILRQFEVYQELVKSILASEPPDTSVEDIVDNLSQSESSSEGSDSDARPDHPLRLSNRDLPRHRSTTRRPIVITLSRYPVFNLPSHIPSDSNLANSLFSPSIVLAIPIPSPKNDPRYIQITITVLWNGKLEIQVFDGGISERGEKTFVPSEQAVQSAVEESLDLGVTLWVLRSKIRESAASGQNARNTNNGVDRGTGH